MYRTPAKKMRVEVYDDEGNRYTVIFQGKVNREKALRLFDIIELLGGMPNEPRRTIDVVRDLVNVSKIDKTKLIIEKFFSIIWFSSKEVLKLYKKEFEETISLSTISTYLARMTDRGFLLKKGASNNRKYRMTANLTENTLKIVKNE